MLEQHGILRRIKRVGGASAGAINASLLTLGYSLGEIRDILATRLSQVYSKDHSPALPVADAVRRSMSIPLFFAAVRESDDLFVDGGVLDNYPIRLFDREKYVANCDRKRHTAKPPHYAGANRERCGNTSPYVYNRETLGFRLDCRKEISLFRDGAAPK